MARIEVSEFHVIICWSLSSKIGDCQLQRHSSQVPQFFEVFSEFVFHADLNYILVSWNFVLPSTKDSFS